jgi:NAD(P)-dependent dehydrogenase (short-subunit alcohol dehydrogenase family)
MQANSYALTDKQILVTGASSGLGAATACACAEGGAHVILSGRNEEKLQQVMQQLSGTGHQSFPLDLCKAEDLDAFCESLPELDGICFSAGITRTIPVKRIKSSDIEDIFKTNLISSIMMVNQLVKLKKLKKNASIVFIASINTSYADMGNSLYAATKGGMVSFARVLALELASKGIRVNCVSPGFVPGTGMTETLKRLSEAQLNLERSKYPLGFGEPSDIANGVVYLLSDAAKWVTGITLTIDGGITLK